MSNIISKEVQLAARPDGEPKESDFQTVEVSVGSPGAGEFLVQNLWMSVDPYMRGRMMDRESYVPPFQIGETMDGGCIGKVIESNNENFAVGDYVNSMNGWREFYVTDGLMVNKIDPAMGPIEANLGTLGMPGMTAYAGLFKVAGLKDGENVFVSAASGAVGAVVCQLAKAHGCYVVGSAGSDDKCKWLEEVAGIDKAINYMNPYGRAALCGMIEQYNDKEPRPGPNNLIQIVGKSLKLEGFIVSNHLDIIPDFYAEMAKLIGSGKMKTEQTVEEGIENAPKAFLNLFSGANFGRCW